MSFQAGTALQSAVWFRSFLFPADSKGRPIRGGLCCFYRENEIYTHSPLNTYLSSRAKASCTRESDRAGFMRMAQGPWNIRPSCQATPTFQPTFSSWPMVLPWALHRPVQGQEQHKCDVPGLHRRPSATARRCSVRVSCRSTCRQGRVSSLRVNRQVGAGGKGKISG